MIKKLFLIVTVAAFFVACGGNQPAKQADTETKQEECTEKKECTAVCISKVVENPEGYVEETVIGGKLVKCPESGDFYAAADSTKVIQIIPAEGLVIEEDWVGGPVMMKGKVVDGKLHVSSVEKSECKGNKDDKKCCEGDKTKCDESQKKDCAKQKGEKK